MNLFNIWDEIGQKTPFAARRTHWSDKNIYVIVERVEPDGKGYGNPTTGGYLNTYFEHNKAWRQSEAIPNAGVCGWEHVEGVSLELKQTASRIGKKVEEDQFVSKDKLGDICSN